MATSNQIQLRNVKETERSNRAKEKISLAQLDETIRNNNLINKVNVSRNQIQRLANDQLNERELRKLSEQINLEYDKLNELAYKNDADIDLTIYKQEFQEFLDKAKNQTQIRSAIINALGRSVGSLFKIIGTNIPVNYVTDYVNKNPSQIWSLLSGNVPVGFYDDPRIGQFITPEQKSNLEKNHQSENDIYSQFYEQENRHEREMKSLKDEYEGKINSRPKYSGSRSRTQIYRRKEYNEIPSDYSQSKGPGFVEAPPHQTNAPIYYDNGANDTKTHSYSNHGHTSGGTDYTLSGGHKSSGVIYSPGAN